jgi:FMN phosphatase YigB (HAD superfamily)
MGLVRLADLDAVTIDAYGTLVTIVDPVTRLERLLPEHAPPDIERAFHVEADFYRTRSSQAHDESSVVVLRRDCAQVFNEALGSSISAEDYAGAMAFAPLPGVVQALVCLRGLGLELAVVGNWDWSLHERLAELELRPFFAAVVPAAGKPSPAGILRALEKLGISPARALHIGDEDADEHAARAAGVHFARAPLPEAVASLA